MKKLMSCTVSMLFLVLMITSPCFSQDSDTQMTPEEETSIQTDQTDEPAAKPVEETIQKDTEETTSDSAEETVSDSDEETASTSDEETAAVSDEETTAENAEAATAPEPESPREAVEEAVNPPAEGSADIVIDEAVICTDVVDREPVGTGDIFSSQIKKVMCFTRVVGAKNETEILHNWYFQEDLVASVNLRVGSENWRTFSSKSIVPEYAGEWKVEILSQNGKVLKKIYFILE